MGDKECAIPEYLEKECEYLRERLSVNIEETSNLERYAIGITGGIWAWIGTHESDSIPVLFWLPLLLVMFLGLRAIAVYFRIKTIRKCLAKLETFAKIPHSLEWFSSYETCGARFRFLTAVLFWFFINIVNFGLALIARGQLFPLLNKRIM